MPRGGGGRGAGRKIGSKTIRSKAVTQMIVERASSGGLTPLEVMLMGMREYSQGLTPNWDKALAFAEKAAPYIHPRLAAVEHSGKDGKPFAITISGPLAGK